MTKLEERMNAAIADYIETSRSAERAEENMLDVLTDQEKTKTGKHNVTIKFQLQRAIDLRGKIAEYYESVLNLLETENVKWKEVTFYLQTEVFKDSYPMRDNGKPEPLNKARDNGNEAAIVINRFNAYRAKYSDYGIPKIKVEKVVSTGSTETEKATERAIENMTETRDQQKEEKTTGKAVVFNKADIPVALVFMYKDVETSDNLELVKAVETLAEHYQIDL